MSWALSSASSSTASRTAACCSSSASGLSVTMGLMNFVNLAHGAFAMLGGFLCVELTRRLGMPFLLTLPVVFVAVGLVGAALERLLYRRLYRAQPPRSGAVHDRARVHGGRRRDLGVGAVAAAGAAAGFSARADQRVRDRSRRLPAVSGRARGRGHRRAGPVPRRGRGSARSCAPRSTTSRRQPAWASTSACCSALTFALGSGLAGLGGALAIDVLGLDPTFALKYLVYFLWWWWSAARARSRARWSRRSCSASSTSRASTTCPRSAASSSTPPWWRC